MYKKIYRNMCVLAMTTLIISAILIISSCYTYFDIQFKKEIQSEAEMLAALLELSQSPENTLRELSYSQKRITLTDSKGMVLYDNVSTDEVDHTNRPEIIQAQKTGYGTCDRHSHTLGKKQHYTAIRLSNNQIIRLSAQSSMPAMYYTILIAVLFVTALMYLLCAIVASRLTDSIVSPIEKINISDNSAIDSAYVEIQPFLKRIASQNEEITRQTVKVTEQKARLRAIMDNINEGLLIADNQGEIMSVNTPAMEILCIDPQEIKHKKITQLTSDEKIHTVLRKALGGEKNNIMFEARERAYQIFYSPVYEKGTISGAVLLLFDVTERTNTEKIRREFTANVSHELKTPLTTIHGYSQIIDSGIAKPDDIKGFVKKIEKESSRLMTLVDDIIALSHLDEASGDVPKESFSLALAAGEATEALTEKANQKDISLSMECDNTVVYANFAQTVEMIYNLADNSIKYNTPGGSVSVVVSNGCVSVSDTGIGIPEKYTDRIFERFFRVDKSHSKKVNGTGLGLSIVKHLAKANNAVIDVKSTVGEGSTFTITFRKDVELEGNI